MGETSDETSTEFDEYNKANQLEVKKVAKLLAEFKPTIIIIEQLAKYDSISLINYLDYVKNPNKEFKNPTEVELLAYKVGRLSGTQKIYGINFRESYDYNIGKRLDNAVDRVTSTRYWELFAENKRNNPEEGISFYDLFKLINHPQYLESTIITNADLLTYTSSKGKSEGADEAIKYYHRNLVMFSNLNQIPINENDSVFILLGASHTAFFNDFLKRSPKYKLENPFTYLGSY